MQGAGGGSSKHNFGKFLVSDLKLLMRTIHQNQTNKKSAAVKIPEDVYLYSKFFWEILKGNANLKAIRDYLKKDI